jgi:hypothetical protein
MRRRAASADYSQSGADGQQAQHDRRIAQPAEEFERHRRQFQAAQVGGDAGQRRQDQGIAQQFAQHAGLAMARQHPHRHQVGRRHHEADHDAHGGDAGDAIQRAGDRQADVGIETEGALVLRGKGDRRDRQQARRQAQQHAARPSPRRPPPASAPLPTIRCAP